VVPDIEAGNMLAKQLEYVPGADLAGIVIADHSDKLRRQVACEAWILRHRGAVGAL
jgi:hypothetical protein